ncbi:MAG: hypothetical protein WC665_11570 [Sulfurimonas sp.]|jgi:hypothetical protein
MGFLKGTANFVTFGAVDRSDAKKITKNAHRRKDDIKEELDDAKENTQNDIKNLGILKETTYSETIGNFLKSYEVIGKVDLKPLKQNEVLDYDNFQTDFKEMKIITTNIKEISTAVAGGALIGTTAAFGAMGTAAIIGTASTGTAIGTLSGAAATNATLAWLGGGAVSAGGAGMTGGMVVLGGIALAPILVFGMFLGTNKGKQALNEAHNYSDEIDVLVEKVITLIAELSQIRRGCYLMSESIQGLDALMKVYNIEMDKIAYRLEQRSAIAKFIDPIKNKIFNIDILSTKEAETFATSANIASMLSEIIRMPLIDEEGAFISNSLEVLECNNQEIEELKLRINHQG